MKENQGKKYQMRDSPRKERSDKGGTRTGYTHSATRCNVCHAKFVRPFMRLDSDLYDADGQLGHTEMRPTGGGFKIQPWLYCLQCWERHLGICAEPFNQAAFARVLSAMEGDVILARRA